MARIVDTCVLSLLDDRPPHYLDRSSGSAIKLPTTILGRLGYSLDLLFSHRGTSYYPGRHWNWASAKVAAYRAPRSISTRRFILNTIAFTFFTYLGLDCITSYIYVAISPILKARSYDNYAPITSLLPLWQQLICVSEFFLHTIAAYVAFDTILLVVCVGSGLSSDMDNWPPPFEDPLSSGSLPHFWSQAWHSIYRQFFLRFSFPFVYFLFPSSRRTIIRQTKDGRTGSRLTPAAAYVTMILCFLASGIYHFCILFRVRLATPPGADPQPYPSLLQFWKYDLSAANFFFAQPIGITIDMILLRPIFGASSKVRRIFAWAWVLYTVRWWVDAWAVAGMLDGDEPLPLGSPIGTITRLLSKDWVSASATEMVRIWAIGSTPK